MTLAVALILTAAAAACGQGVHAPARDRSVPGGTPAPSLHRAARCAEPRQAPGAEAIPPAARPDGLSDEERATLGSLRRIGDYPLYTMRFRGSHHRRASSSGITGTSRAAGIAGAPADSSLPGWSCSLFAALGDPEDRLYGRNFDWEYSPALLLFVDPPDGYASVSMVDISYLGFGGVRAGALTELALSERRQLLRAPSWPFDGMNEHGLVVGMAAVPEGQLPWDPRKKAIGSLAVIREMLDHARDVDEAVRILRGYNVDMKGGPQIHYLVADRSGRSSLVELQGGEVVVIPGRAPWHLATNFVRASVGLPQGRCWRYDTISRRLEQTQGRLTARGAMDLLAAVSQENTQWSVVYGMVSGDVSIVMGRNYADVKREELY